MGKRGGKRMDKQKVYWKNFVKGWNKFEFSKLIVIFETILIAILTIKILSLIELSIRSQFDGLFPYLTTLVSVAWAAYGTSVSFYYNKAKLENKIKLEKLGASKDLLMQEPYIKEPKGKIVDNIDSVDVSDDEDDDGALG